jgi:DoxX-like family
MHYFRHTKHMIMQKNNILYWLTTSIISAMALSAAYAYFFNPTLPAAFQEFGFPDWFRKELGVAKVLGALALLIPQVPTKFKEWAYAGFTINFLSAAMLHFSTGHPMKDVATPIVLTLILWASNYFYYKK